MTLVQHFAHLFPLFEAICFAKGDAFEIADDRLSALMARYLQDARRALIAVFLRYARTASA